jgi:hypothetical protein
MWLDFGIVPDDFPGFRPESPGCNGRVLMQWVEGSPQCPRGSERPQALRLLTQRTQSLRGGEGHHPDGHGAKEGFEIRRDLLYPEFAVRQAGDAAEAGEPR